MELNKRYSSCIARRAVKQGARPSVMDQAEVEKLMTGTNSSIESLHGNQNQEESNPGPSDTPSQQIRAKGKRMKWTREEYKLVLYAYYYAPEKPSETNCTTRTYKNWRNNNKDVRPHIDANKLANVRRDIVKNKRLTDEEIHKIKEEIRKDIVSESNDNTSEDTNKGKEQHLTALADNIVGKIFQCRDIVTEKMTETDTEDIAIETLEKDRTENLESTTPMLQNIEIKIIKEKILRELGIIQNTKISNRGPLHKIQNNREKSVENMYREQRSTGDLKDE